jgi:hypothetical protein
MKKLMYTFNTGHALLGFVLMAIALMFFQSCVALNGEKMKSWSEMTPKEKVVVAYSTYNSEYANYMLTTGWMMGVDGAWEKVTNPVLSEEQKNILRKKKAILIKMWPMVRLYDSMTIGKTPYSAKTEADLYELITDLAGLVPG